MNQFSDEDLYSLVLEKSGASFKVLYNRHSGPLFRFIYRFTINRESAEEILQDIFIQLLSGKFKSSLDANLKNWLYTLAKNKSLNHLKKTSFETKNESLVVVASSDNDLESKTIDGNLLDKLAFAEELLPDDLKKTWQLRKQGFDYQQIAAKLSIPIGTVKSRFNRLVNHLKKEFQIEP